MDLTLDVGEYKLNIRGAVVINHNGKIFVNCENGYTTFKIIF